MQIKCKIQTPQFKNKQVHEMKVQMGVFDTVSKIFTPHSVGYGNHTVYFNSTEDWEKALRERYNDDYNF